MVGSMGAELLDALAATPFSASLKQNIWSELFDARGLRAGPEGVAYCVDSLTPDPLGGEEEAEELVARAKLGRAGIALMSAFRALSAVALNEIGGGHET